MVKRTQSASDRRTSDRSAFTRFMLMVAFSLSGCWHRRAARPPAGDAARMARSKAEIQRTDKKTTKMLRGTIL